MSTEAEQGVGTDIEDLVLELEDDTRVYWLGPSKRLDAVRIESRNALLAAIRSLRQELAVAREDTRRLDWLSDRGCVHADVFWMDLEDSFAWCPCTDRTANLTLRQAIDAANQAEATGNDK